MWIHAAKMRLPVASRYSLGSFGVNNQPIGGICRIKELEGCETHLDNFHSF